MSGRAGQILAGVVTAAVLAGTSQAAAPDRVTEPTWKRALWIRSDALNQRYGLGEYSRGAAPTAEPSWRRALRIRGEAMNRTHPTWGCSIAAEGAPSVPEGHGREWVRRSCLTSVARARQIAVRATAFAPKQHGRSFSDGRWTRVLI